MLSDFGIRQNLVCSIRTDDAYYRTAWTVQLLRGLGIAMIVVVLARPFAEFYESPELEVFLWIVAAANVAMGLNNIEIMRSYRQAALGRIAIIDNVAALLGLCLMVVWAWLYPSSVALAVGAVVSTALFTLGSHVGYSRHNCRWKLEPEAVSELVSFGKWVLLSTVLAFATTQMDKLAFARLMPLDVIGFYAIAWIWASMPGQLLGQWAVQVFFPLVSHYERIGGRREAVTWRVRRWMGGIAMIATILVYAASDLLVTTLYKPDYQLVAGFIRDLAFISFLYSVEDSYSHVLIARGKPREKLAGQLFSFALFAVLLLPVFSRFGIRGAIVLLGICAVVRIFWMAYKLFGTQLGELRFDVYQLVTIALVAEVIYFTNSSIASHGAQIGAVLFEGVIGLWLVHFSYMRIRKFTQESELPAPELPPKFRLPRDGV
jgi:O-antigen/teichoic acid export membrane protein